MKKNLMMRIASVVLVLTLMSTCAISGTFAKYVTTASGTDEARTAVWDIEADFEALADGDTTTMFKTSYVNDSNKATVKSAGTTTGEDGNTTTTYDKVVAPGTKDDYTYGLKGAPEVDYKVTFGLENGENNKPSDVTLKVGNYKYTDSVYQNMDVDVTTAYLPLKWKVTITTTNGSLTDTATDKFVAGTAREFASLAAIQTALSTLSVAFDANEICDVDVKIEWEWPFTNSENGNVDKMDTVLGYYAKQAKDSSFTLPFTPSGEGAGAITTVSYDFYITATQVD